MILLVKTTIDRRLPTRPKLETVVKRTPSTQKENMDVAHNSVEFSSTNIFRVVFKAKQRSGMRQEKIFSALLYREALF